MGEFHVHRDGIRAVAVGPKENFGRLRSPVRRDWSRNRRGWDSLDTRTGIVNQAPWDWNQFGLFMYDLPFSNLTYQTGPFTPTGLLSNIQLMWQTPEATEGHPPTLQAPTVFWVPVNDAQQYGTEQTNILTYTQQMMDQFITGQASLTTGWSSYVNTLKGMGLANYLALSQKAAGKPFNIDTSAYHASASDIKYLLREGPVPAIQKTYLIQEGVPASDFAG